MGFLPLPVLASKAKLEGMQHPHLWHSHSQRGLDRNLVSVPLLFGACPPVKPWRKRSTSVTGPTTWLAACLLDTDFEPLSRNTAR